MFVAAYQVTKFSGGHAKHECSYYYDAGLLRCVASF